MKPVLFLIMIATLAASLPALAAGNGPMSPGLQELAISAGHWVYHGETLQTPHSKAGKWTWDEHCGWSENREFMVCSFTNDWAGRIVKSLVVDTWNEKDKSFWHYELFSTSGTRAFASRMTIHGNTRVELAKSVNHGRAEWTRITYVFDSPVHVNVKLETSSDGAKWVTVDQGTGVKQP